ncbi:hypothetical protein JIN77_10395 [Verrucomicrobiaceae bacterium R5-34]|uniref:Uncharacterized protein n=1 Tax=Oceaniferula flava TaxID=2800421 RepID=A0AAE2SEW5_9BACT|nr:hypothetical protein [Oceaniferula flavus]MBK1831137.1 hypothetical protein [Verrucomicrobiaceae bacterium R5-34]MBK1855654.1 hypothetical protein [Oceaniferula flavus]MBM1136960.1 hypothetical protein [Oceaniferula flavus]
MFAKTYLLFLLLPVLLGLGSGMAAAKDSKNDAGKEKIGKIQATVYYGTNGSVENLGRNATPVPKAISDKLGKIEKFQFSHYRQLGSDSQPVLRSYENWVSPLKPSEEIMLSFESRGVTQKTSLRLDLELWQHRRKVMKSDPVLHPKRPLYILGPKWREGRLIIAVELISLNRQ